IGLALGEAGDSHREPARRAEGFRRRFGRKTVLAELVLDRSADLIRQRWQPRGGQLLAADFEQQLAIHLPAFAFGYGAAGSAFAFAFAFASGAYRYERRLRSGLLNVRVRDAHCELAHAQDVSG